MIDDGTIDDLRLEIQLTRCRHPLVETHGVRLRVPNGNMYRMQSYAGGGIYVVREDTLHRMGII